MAPPNPVAARDVEDGVSVALPLPRRRRRLEHSAAAVADAPDVGEVVVAEDETRFVPARFVRSALVPTWQWAAGQVLHRERVAVLPHVVDAAFPPLPLSAAAPSSSFFPFEGSLESKAPRTARSDIADAAP